TLNEFIDELVLTKLRISAESSALVDQLVTAPVNKRLDIARQLESLAKSSGADTKAFRKSLDKVSYLFNPIIKVRSFSTIENLTSVEDEMDLHPLLPEGELTSEALATFQQEVRENPLFKDLLISQDEKVTTIQIEMAIPKDDNRSTGNLYSKIVEIVDESNYSGKIYLAGNPIVEAEMARSMERDNMIFFPFVMLVISLILYTGFKSLSGIYVPLTIAGLTTIWTLGLMVAMGLEQNIVTTVLPVFLLTVAVADAIHFYNYYIANEEGLDGAEQRLGSTLSYLTRPLVLTSITTFIGFIALAWTDIIFIHEFGLLMATGVIFALLITLLVAPILVLNVPSNRTSKSVLSEGVEAKLMSLVETVLTNPRKSLMGIAVVACISIASLQNLKFDQENVNNFDPDTVLRSHNDAILEHFDGTNPIDIWIDTGSQGGIYNPDVIKGIQKLERYLEAREGIGFVLTPVDFLERMYNLLTHEGHMLPEDFNEQLIAQEILVYENERSQDIKHVIDDQHRHARLIVLGESDAASFWGPVLDDIEALTPAGTSLENNGYGKVMFTNIEEVIKTNISSTIIALSLISLVMIFLFKSVMNGVIGIIPLVLTVLMNYAAMAASGVAVDVGTTIIASIAFGIGIDYSIHFLSSIERQVKAGEKDLIVIMQNATKTVGIPIVINSLTLAGGFLVLLASNFLVLQLLGLFIAMTMMISAFNALVLIPLCYYLWHRNSERFVQDEPSMAL
ncbi:hypothetical protein A3766_06775, partial [Oleiphilus sp. HI0132]|uniref:efflux RND transporter permease subunit n=2 Tax=Oleiphilus sp. HI0132 TaxID=1822270 RepID=UPI0007C311F2